MSVTAPSPIPPAAPAAITSTRVCAGVDWAKDDHAVCVLGPEGEVLERFSVRHDGAGLRGMTRRLLGMTRRLLGAGVTDVGIERPDGPVVQALLQTEITVLVIPPAQVKNLRSRYGSAGNKDDRFDAYVLADTVRTDHRRLRPLVRDTSATIALRTTVRARRDLVAHRVAVANQLRAHLQLVFPGAVGLFWAIDSAISLAFLARFTSQDQADWLSPRRMGAWLRSVGYCGRTTPEALHARLDGAARGATGDHALLHAGTTTAYLSVLRALNTQIEALATSISEQLALHPDACVVTNLPKAGTVRAARLLAEIGDARGRFPTADSLACLAGVAPSTRQSGKVRSVSFRWGADKQLRDALCDFAGDSRHANAWAADLYDRAIARGHDHPHAVRILARAWVDVIWRCWQDHTTYDPTTHRALQRVLNQDQPAAA